MAYTCVTDKGSSRHGPVPLSNVVANGLELLVRRGCIVPGTHGTIAKNAGKPAVLGPATMLKLGIDLTPPSHRTYLCGNAHWVLEARLPLSLPLGETPALERCARETTQDSCWNASIRKRFT